VPLTRRKLSAEVEDVLDLPREHGEGEGYKIVNAVIQAIATALRQHKRVDILGLGTFTLRTRKAVKKNANFNLSGKKVTPFTFLVPPKTYVHFRPSNDIMRTLNEQD
jgi:nucleoid DNA-binding protein